MREKIDKLIDRFAWVVFPVLVLVLFLTNYQTGTWLSGWDNLHPEFNFAVNIKRTIFAGWQEYQGLGLIGGMGHAADLVRQIVLWVCSLVLPTHLLRYFYHFLMLALGPIGIYFLARELLANKGKGEVWAALGAGMFYLFNPVTLQMFFLPYEPFSAHFAALPWLLWAVIRFLTRPDRRGLVLLVLVNFLATPQAYVGTFFLVYILLLTLLLAAFVILYRVKFLHLVLIGLIVFATNAFWLLPNLYFVVKHSGTNIGAKSNLMSTTQTLLQNQKYGEIGQVIRQKGYWLDLVEMSNDGVLGYIFGSWRSYFDQPGVVIISWLIIASILIGLVGVLWRKEKRFWLVLPIGFFALVILANRTVFFTPIVELFYKLPLFAQVFRTPFTKFAFAFVLVMALLFGFVVSLVSRLVTKQNRLVLTFILVTLPAIYLLPLVNKGLFYAKEQAKIPDSYFQLFKYLNSQPDRGRIANLPQYSYWGWTFYDWNYSGSGFLWYGLGNPVLDRTFDVWSSANEQYYWEISYAIFAKNQTLFDQVLDKYDVTWLLFDDSVIASADQRSLGKENVLEMIRRSSKFTLAASFGSVSLYQVNKQVPINSFVYVINKAKSIDQPDRWMNSDSGFEDSNDYVTKLTGNDKYYPFADLFSGRKDKPRVKITDNGSDLVFEAPIPAEYQSYRLFAPIDKPLDLTWVNTSDLGEIRYFVPSAEFDGQVVRVRMPKTEGVYRRLIKPVTELKDKPAVNCNAFSTGQVTKTIDEAKGLVRLTAEDAVNCVADFGLRDLPNNIGYLVKINNQNISGRGLLFWLADLDNRRPFLEQYLTSGTSWLVQPPLKVGTLGYSLHFDSVSVGQEKTVNDLGQVEVIPLPYDFLTKMVLVKADSTEERSSRSLVGEVYHPNPSFYQVTTNASSGQILALSQAYHEGWTAYLVKSSLRQGYGWQAKLGSIWEMIRTLFVGKKLDNHVLVNNWANGWELQDDRKQDGSEQSKNGETVTINIVFLPQFLEFIGFGLGGVAILGVLIYRPRKSE